VEEFFELVESSKTECWSESDKIQVIVFKITEVVKHFTAVAQNYTIEKFHGKNLRPNFCTDLKMSEVTNITLCNFRQSGKRKTKIHRNVWTLDVL
jgi:hypothetical protein